MENAKKYYKVDDVIWLLEHLDYSMSREELIEKIKELPICVEIMELKKMNRHLLKLLNDAVKLLEDKTGEERFDVLMELGISTSEAEDWFEHGGMFKNV